MLVPRRASLAGDLPAFRPPHAIRSHERLPEQETVGEIAINDSFMLEASIYYLLKKHFRQDKFYVDILELFLEVRPRPAGRDGKWTELSLSVNCRQRSRPKWVS